MKLERLIAEEVVLTDILTVSQEALSKRAQLLDDASRCSQATDVVSANSMADSARTLRTYISDVQEIGLEWRRPIRALLNLATTKESEYLAPLIAKQTEHEKMATDWKKAEERRVAEEQRKRDIEIARLERERKAAEALANEERERVERENREAGERAKVAEANITNQADLDAAVQAEARRKADAIARQAQVDAEAEAARKASEAAQAAIRAPVPTVHKLAGLATKRVMAYTVTDIAKVYAARPELCNLEIKPSAVRAVCVPRFLPESDEVDTESVPGLALQWLDSTSTRKW